MKEEKEGFKDSGGKLYYDIDWQFVKDLGALMFQNKVENNGKYIRENWKKDLTIKYLEDALQRHTISYFNGETDEEHDLAMTANIMMLRYLKRTKT